MNTDLQTVFYVMGIVYMSLMFLLFIALLVTVLVIKSKISRAIDDVEKKFQKVESFAEKAKTGAHLIRSVFKGIGQRT